MKYGLILNKDFHPHLDISGQIGRYIDVHGTKGLGKLTYGVSGSPEESISIYPDDEIIWLDDNIKLHKIIIQQGTIS